MTSFPDRHSHEALEAQLRDVLGRIIYTHKTHEKMADRLSALHIFSQWSQTILAGITTTSILLVVLGDSKTGDIISVTLSTLLFIFNLFLQNNDFGQRAQKHTETAAILWGIRETYMSLITDLLSPAPDIESIKAERDRLQHLSERVYKTAPRTDSKAYKAAQKGIQHNEEFTFSEQEIDLLLPEELRKSTRRKRKP